MQPDYLVVFDALSEARIEYAKKLQLPIVFIDSNKYANKKELKKKDLYAKENYVQDEYDERKELGRY